MPHRAALAARESPDALLSPGQLAILKRTREVLGKDPKALAGLKPDRSADGVGAYAAALEAVLKK